MNRPDLFNSSINKLVKAYFNNTLQHGKCSACAVGNILGAQEWGNLFLTRTVKKTGEIKRMPFRSGFAISFSFYGANASYIDINLNKDAYRAYMAARSLIAASGYNIDELQEIEYAFEKVPYFHEVDEKMFLGLMAVVDVLAEIHEVDIDSVEQSRLLFQRV